MSLKDGPERRETAFYGRRKGHKLRARQADVFAGLLPRLRIDPAMVTDPALLFPGKVSDVWLEIGFGGGEHLLAQALANPTIGFIGCEPFINGMAKLLSEIETRGITNIRLYDNDAMDLLGVLPDTLLGQYAKQVHGIIIIEADIRDPAGLNLGQQLCHSVDEWFTSNKPDRRVGERLRKQMLPAAETDFQPDIGNLARKQQCRVSHHSRIDS